MRFHRCRAIVFRNVDGRRVVARRFYRIPTASGAGERLAVVTKLGLFRDSGLLRLCPPIGLTGGLGGGLRCTRFESRIVISRHRLRGTTGPEITIIAGRGAIARTQGGAILRRSRSHSRIVMLPDHDERVQRNGPSCALRRRGTGVWDLPRIIWFSDNQ
jgi:hypothetical protein